MRSLIQTFFLRYLRILAKVQLLKNKPTIVGITGSAGKTSTRDAVALVLRTTFTCKVSEKANSHTGIPLDILGLHLHDYSLLDWVRVTLLAPIMLLVNWERYQIYIAEMGVDSPFEPKNMGYLLKIIQPHTGVFINALPVHSEPYDTLIAATEPAKRSQEAAELIAAEKGRLITNLPPSGTAVLNVDDERVSVFAGHTVAQVIKVGQHNADLKIVKHSFSVEGFSMTFTYQDNEYTLDIPGQVLGAAYAVTFGLAIGVGIAHGVSISDAIQALKGYRLPPGRMTLLSGINDSLLLDSSYNASTKPMLDALDVLHELGSQTKRPTVAVLGDMRELGKEAGHEHKVVAKAAGKAAQEIVLVGSLMKKYVLPILEKDLGKDKVHWFENSAQAADYVKTHLPNKAIVLAKGSQNTIFLERVVEALLADPGNADKVLARRGAYWDQLRNKYI